MGMFWGLSHTVSDKGEQIFRFGDIVGPLRRWHQFWCVDWNGGNVWQTKRVEWNSCLRVSFISRLKPSVKQVSFRITLVAAGVDCLFSDKFRFFRGVTATSTPANFTAAPSTSWKTTVATSTWNYTSALITLLLAKLRKKLSCRSVRGWSKDLWTV